MVTDAVNFFDNHIPNNLKNDDNIIAIAKIIEIEIKG